MMQVTKPQIEVKSSMGGAWHWLVDSNKKRLTPKFKTRHHKNVGNFTVLNTNRGVFVYNIYQNELLYFSQNESDFICLRQLSEHLYVIEYGRADYRTCKLYTETGALVKTLSNARDLINGLIAAKKDNLWGYIDEAANDVIPFKYYTCSNFNEYGYSEVSTELNNYTVIDKSGKEMFNPVNCSGLQFLSPTILRVICGASSFAYRYGVIDISGNEIIPVIYSQIVPTAGFYKVKYNDKWGLFDKNGNVIFEPIYDEIIETPEKFVVKDFAKLEVPKNKEVLKK